MRRLITVLINWGLCICITIILRCLIAIPHRAILELARPIIIYNPWNVFPWHILLLMPIIINCTYYYYIEKFPPKITLGEQIAGIRVVTKWKIWLAFFDITAIIFYPITITYIWLTGRMPYDRLLKIEIQYVKKQCLSIKKRHRLLSFLTGSIVLLYILLQVVSYNFSFFYYCLWPLTTLIETNLIANVYTSCIEPKSYCLGQTRIPRNETGIREKDIFSYQGQKEPWAFVAVNEEDSKQYEDYGVFKDFDYSNDVLVVTYGRELKTIRIIDEPDIAISDDEPLGGYPFAYLHLELKEKYRRNTVYFYAVPKINIYKLTDDYHDMTNVEMISYVNIVWVGTDYNLYKNIPASSRFITIGQGGILSRWIWAYRWFCGHL